MQPHTRRHIPEQVAHKPGTRNRCPACCISKTSRVSGIFRQPVTTYTPHVRFGRNRHPSALPYPLDDRFTRNGHPGICFPPLHDRFGRIGHPEGENLKSTIPGANPEIPPNQRSRHQPGDPGNPEIPATQRSRQPRDPANPATQRSRQPGNPTSAAART